MKINSSEKMGYHIIMDSVGDRSIELVAMSNFSVVALSIIIDDEEIIDNDKIEQKTLINKIAKANKCPKSSCASPAQYLEIFKSSKEDRIYVITASSELTGSYNSAKIGKELFIEEFPDAKIEIIDSKSASAGETLLAYKIIELEKEYNNFGVVVKEIKQFIKEQEIIFVLEDITFLQKNGRLTAIKAMIATALNIVPVLIGDDNGIIRLKGKARGIRKALTILKKSIIDGIKEGKKKILVISHCNCGDRAAALKRELLTSFPDLKIKIVSTGGIGTLYAGNHGIVVSY